MSRLLRFSLGPVGAFIGEARRTRDYWAGSFLLSWLSGEAIVAANRAGAEILEPCPLKPRDVDDADLDDAPMLLRAIAKGPQAPTEYESGLPNQFRALVPDDFDPDLLRDVILEKWRNLAGSVWAEFVEPALTDPEQLERTRDVWTSQIGRQGDREAFWETVWVMGPSDNHQARPDDDWLILRKRRRTPFFCGDEGEGDLCSISRDFRELSGWRRSVDAGRQDAFWSAISARLAELEGGKRARTLDLRASERLSAPALIKRLFARLPVETLASPQLFGWAPPSIARWKARRDASGTAGPALNARYWPSTAAIAATPWLAEVVTHATDAQMRSFAQSVAKLSHMHAVAERQSRIWEPLVYGAETAIPRSRSAMARLLAVDGRFFFDKGLSDERLTSEFSGGHGEVDDADAQRLRETGQALRDGLAGLVEAVGGQTPAEHVALVKLDGDQMGKWKRDAGQRVSAALNAFQNSVARALQEASEEAGARRRAEVLFASADEILVICPAADSLDVAAGLAKFFEEAVCSAFADKEKAPTASVSVVLTRYDVPLGQAVHAVEDMLRWAKRECAPVGGVSICEFGHGGVQSCWSGILDTTDSQRPRVSATLEAVASLVGASVQPGQLDFRRNRILYAIADALSAIDPEGRMFSRMPDPGEALKGVLAGALAGEFDTRHSSDPAGQLGLLSRLAVPFKGPASQESVVGLVRMLRLLAASKTVAPIEVSEGAEA